jgi:DNA gyrase subunit A
MVNLLPLGEGEKVQAVLPVHEYSEDRYVFFATAHGTVKKTPLTEFAYQLQKGKIAINLDEGDALVGVELTDGNSDILLFASTGKVVRFDEGEVRAMGRTATGVRGMKLTDNAEVVSLIVAAEGDILTATERGYGKRTQLEEFPKKGRGTQGVIGIQCSERNGALVAATQVTDAHELMLISNQGTLVRTRVAEVSQLGRNTQGVTLIRLPAEEALVSVVRLDADENNGDEAETGDGLPPEQGGTTDAQPDAG